MGTVAGMLIVEEMFLLLRRDDGAVEDSFAYNSYGLAAAALSDLVLSGAATLGEQEDPVVSLVPGVVPGHAVLRRAAEVLRERGDQPLSALVTASAMDLEKETARSLADAGVVAIEERRFLGLVPAKYPLLSPDPEARLRRRLRDVLAGAEPAPSDGVLLAVLEGLGLSASVLEEERAGRDTEALRVRIEQVVRESVSASSVGPAVADAVKTMNTVILGATFMPIITGGGSAG